MITVKEALAPYSPATFAGDIRLSNFLDEYDNTNKGAAILTKLFGKASGDDINNPSPSLSYDGVLGVCDALGIKTLDDFIAVTEFLSKYNPDEQAFAKALTLTPDIDYNSLNNTTARFIYDSVKAKYIVDAPDSSWWFDDGVYKLITREALDKVSKKYPSKKYKWISERGDCDDSTRIFRGYLSSQAMGNLSVGAVSIVFLDKNNSATFAHKLNLVVFDDGSASLYEPQTNLLREPVDYYTPDTVSYSIYRLEF